MHTYRNIVWSGPTSLSVRPWATSGDVCHSGVLVLAVEVFMHNAGSMSGLDDIRSADFFSRWAILCREDFTDCTKSGISHMQ